MKKLLFLLSCFFLMACSTFTVNNDDHIDPAITENIERLDKQVVKAMKEGDQELFLSLCGKDLLASGRDSIVKLIRNTKELLNTSSYSILHRFHVKTSADTRITLGSGGSDEHAYKIIFQAINRESIISHINLRDDRRTLSVLVTYGLYETAWKLVGVRIAETEYLGMDAFDWYQKAKGIYNKGALVDAANMMSISYNLTATIGEYFRYEKANEIKAFYETTMSEVNKQYRFPFVVTGIATRPSIFRITPLIFPRGIYQLVQYTSQLNVSDTIALARECDSINRMIGTIYKGINIQNDTIAYRVFNELPGNGRSSGYYGFLRKTEK